MFSIISHIDTLMNFDKIKDYIFSENNKNSHVDLFKMRKSNVKIAVFAVFVEPEYKPYYSVQRTIQLIDRFHFLIDRHKELKLIKNYSDVEEILNNNQIGAILAIEGADGIFDLSALRMFFRLGVRMISLTWNKRNHLADGVGEIDANGGLTILGKKMIKEMERLKIIVDVSHIAPAGFWDIVKYTKKPFIASHSNVMRICQHKRNLDDRQIKAIASNQGIIGINFAPFFISNKKKVEINDLIRHIDYIRELVGVDSIVLGTDYDGINSTPRGLENVARLENLKVELFKHGYEKVDVEKIFYKNGIEFFKNVWR